MCVAHIDESYDEYGYEEYDDGMGYGDGYGVGYGTYGSRGGRAMARGAAMRGMGNGRAVGRGRGARGARGGGMVKSAYQSATGHSVHMRGLPFSATETDVVQVDFGVELSLIVMHLAECREMMIISVGSYSIE